MAWAFDETSGHHVLLGDNAALTLPDADWTIAGWVKLDDNAGNFFQYFLSWGVIQASPSLNWFFREASNPGTPNELNCIVLDAGGDDFVLASTGTPGTSTLWQHLVLQRSGNTVTQYINNSADGNGTDVNFDGVDVGANLYLGMREDNNADRRLGGSMAEWAKWDRALGADERAGLAAGFSPLFFTNSLKWYVPMVRPYQERVVPLTVTNQGSTISAHPPIIYPASPLMIALAPAGVMAGTYYRTLLQGDRV